MIVEPETYTGSAMGIGSLWTIQDVSEYLAVPVGTLYQWRHSGRARRSCGWASICGRTRTRCAPGYAIRWPDMASVNRDRRRGNWLARWRDPAGRDRSKSFGRKVDAERFLAQLAADMHRGMYIDPAAGKVTLGTLAETWTSGLEHLKPSTAERYRGIVRRHIVPKWGRWPLRSITHSDVTAWVGELHRSGLGSVRQIYRVLSLILAAAVEDRRIARNPAAGVSLPRRVRSEPRFLTATEVGELAQAAGRYRLCVLVLAFTGLRFGQLVALRVGRVDAARGRITIKESASEVGGELVWSNSTKTHQTRSVPVPGSIMSELEVHCQGRSADAFVFTAPGGGPLRLGNWRVRVFDPAGEAAGLVGVTPHDLRHTAASLAIAAGANVKAVQGMLGHASAAMTLDIYAGLFPDDLDSVAHALDRTAAGLVGQTWDTEGSGEDRNRSGSVPQAADLRRRPVGPVGLEPTTSGLKVRCSTN